ncbi:hypothetical protein SAMN03159288_01131 [Rhizobium sp. NFACC06-2]|nr:hypothetical protein SAMN03159288_01131 [Rhizobium sp. NFACC06-2]
MTSKSELSSGTSLTPADPVLRDFRNFLFLVWKHLNLPQPTDVQYDLAQYLQKGPKRSVIEAFRGVGKSWVTSAFVCWLLLNNPQLNIMVVSAAKDRADAFSTFTKRLIAEMPILEHLKPGKGQRDSNIAFDVGPAGASQSPSVKSVGITGQLTGSRADVIIADDVESLNNAMTSTMRDLLAERIKEFDAVLKPGGRVIYLGTPQTEMSIYNRLPERGYEIRIWPARIPVDPDKYQGRLSPFVMRMIQDGAPAGTPVDPKRFHDLDLLEREASYGRSGFALQFMLDTSLSDQDRYPLKFRDLLVTTLDPRMAPVKLMWSSDPDKRLDIPMVGLQGDAYHRPMWMAPEMAEYTGCVMAIDPSGRGKDETAYAIVKHLNGWLYVVASGGFKDGYGEATLKGLALLAKQHGANKIIVEANFGDGMFTQLLKPVVTRIHACEIEEVKHNQQKERRICDTLEPLMNQHRLVFDQKVIEHDHKGTSEPIRQLMYQMSRITRDRGSLAKDDRLDVLAMAVGYWSESMARDTDKAHEEHLEGLRDKAYEAFIELCQSNSGFSMDDEPSWLN